MFSKDYSKIDVKITALQIVGWIHLAQESHDLGNSERMFQTA
jgi:hypothetical protein